MEKTTKIDTDEFYGFDKSSNPFLNTKVSFVIILINALSIFCTESDFFPSFFNLVDLICCLYFIIEMIAKHRKMGAKTYWHSAHNAFDGILVLISLPSVIFYFLPIESIDLRMVLVLRLFRVFRALRLVANLPGREKIFEGFKHGLTRCSTLIIGLFAFIFTLGLFNCAIFKDLAPEYFGTPMSSIYTVFRLFTIEGWYDIPDAVAANSSPMIGSLTSLYFCILLILGGIIGMSLFNSVFVDAMVEDNNDELEKKVDTLNEKIDALQATINQLTNNNKQIK